MKKRLLGEVLLEQGLLTREQLEEALNEQKATGERLGTILVNKRYITELQLLEALEFALGIPHVELSKMNIDPEAVKLIPAQMARAYQVLPIAVKNGTITLAVADPLNYQAIDDVRLYTKMEVIPVLASQRELETAIRQNMALKVDSRVEKLISELGEEKKPAGHGEEIPFEVEEEAPIIRMVSSLLAQAVEGRASDIHIEPGENDLRVRFRIDGILYDVLTLPKHSAGAVISRVKIMADLDIAEKRLPQDGRARLPINGREVDFRVSTLPTINGEKAVLRVLDRAVSVNTIDQLGLSEANQKKLIALAQRPHGLILVTGPTGSGKTTTLYALLSLINSPEKNIITLEDPVEYGLPGINQVQINVKSGLTFASGLRSVLRQDPDVIMVGEIRDRETAELAVQAALTGHLVLSTLHTNSAASTVARLSDMGIEFYLLASALSGVVSQRLVRRLCPNCRRPHVLDAATAARLGLDEEAGTVFYRSSGCNMCRQTGYAGRIAIQEIMVATDKVRGAISAGSTYEESLERLAVEEGMVTIREDGLAKCRGGLTSLEEVMKAVMLGG